MSGFTAQDKGKYSFVKFWILCVCVCVCVLSSNRNFTSHCGSWSKSLSPGSLCSNHSDTFLISPACQSHHCLKDFALFLEFSCTRYQLSYFFSTIPQGSPDERGLLWSQYIKEHPLVTLLCLNFFSYCFSSLDILDINFLKTSPCLPSSMISSIRVRIFPSCSFLFPST